MLTYLQLISENQINNTEFPFFKESYIHYVQTFSLNNCLKKKTSLFFKGFILLIYLVFKISRKNWGQVSIITHYDQVYQI